MRYTVPSTYSAGQLVYAIRHAKANPDAVYRPPNYETEEEHFDYACTYHPSGHFWVYTGAARGRCYCLHCGAAWATCTTRF